MPQHEQKQCPRCDRLFECKAGSILLCQCQTVYLTPEHLEYVNLHYNECLCSSCLKVVRSEYDTQQYTDKINRFMNKCWR